MNKTVLVFGGAGFLGKHVLVKLLSKGFTKIICADLTNPCIEGIEFYQCDILSAELLKVTGTADIIINCTGQITNPVEKCLQLNSKGVLNILRFVTTQCYFIQISTVGVYGEVDIADESVALNPQTAYSTAKAMAELIIQKHFEAKTLILRLSNLYGPGQPKGLMAYLKRSLDTDKILEFNHSGNMFRSFIHVEDCAEIISNFASKIPATTGVYNVGSNENYAVPDLIKLVEEIKEVKFKTTWGDRPSWENIRQIKTDKLKEILSFDKVHTIANYIRSEF